MIRRCSGGSRVYILGASGVAIIVAGVRNLYCHSKPPLTSGKLSFIINFIGGTGGPEFLLGLAAAPCPPPLNRPCDADIPHHLAGDQQAYTYKRGNDEDDGEDFGENCIRRNVSVTDRRHRD